MNNTIEIIEENDETLKVRLNNNFYTVDPASYDILNRVINGDLDEVSNEQREYCEKILQESHQKKKEYFWLRFKVLPDFLVKGGGKLLSPLFNKYFFLIPALSIFYVFWFSLNNIENYYLINYVSNSNFIFCILSIFALIVTHELGHASAFYKYTGKVAEIGIGVYYIFPVMYSDVNESWRLNSRERLGISAAGVLYQLPMTAIYVASVDLAGMNVSAVFISVWSLVSIVFTLNPLLKFDGYWILTDLLNCSDFHKIYKETLKGKGGASLGLKSFWLLTGLMLLYMIVIGYFIISSLMFLYRYSRDALFFGEGFIKYMLEAKISDYFHLSLSVLVFYFLIKTLFNLTIRKGVE